MKCCSFAGAGADVCVWESCCASHGYGVVVRGCGESDGACVVVNMSQGECVWMVVLCVLFVVHPLPWCPWWQWGRVSVSVVVG